MKQLIKQSIVLNIFLLALLITASYAQSKDTNKNQKPKPPIFVETPKSEKKTSEQSKETEDNIYKINPTLDSKNPSKLYIPKDLEDSFGELNKMLHPKFIEKFKNGGKEETIKQHRGLGLWMRNNWGLWAGSRLAKYFTELGITHPDDMSGIILTSYQRHLNNQPLELEKQIKYYKDYWKKQKS